MLEPLPGCQIGLWLDKPQPGARMTLRNDLKIPSPGPGEVLIKLEATGVCHSDVRSIYGVTPGETEIAGHEGVGRIVKLGFGVPDTYLNLRAGIKWLYSSCHKCEICKVNTTSCPYQRNSGRNVPGTFQQYIVSPAEEMTIIPEGIDSEKVAPMMCAGLSMYSSVDKVIQHCQPGDFLVLPGAGGGLGHLALQIASKRGLKVIAIDGGESKRSLCTELGAAAFLDFTKDNVEEGVLELTGGYGAHALICIPGSEAAYIQAPKLIRRTGLLVCVGLPSPEFHLPISPFEMVVRGLTVVGNSAGNKKHMDELLKMVVAGDVEARVEVTDFDKANEVVERLDNYQIEGRVVLKIPP